MTSPELFVRALPERFDLVEAYSYRFDLSKASSVAPLGPPSGTIRAVYPYQPGTWSRVPGAGDGAETPPSGGPPAESGERTATAGHLLFADWQKTDLEESILPVKGLASAPLRVPVWIAGGGGVAGAEAWRRSAVVLEGGYAPRPPDTVPLAIDVSLMDRDAWAAEELVQKTRNGKVTEDQLARALERPEVDGRGLLLILSLVLTQEAAAPPIVTRVALAWPTIPWPESLCLLDGPGDGPASQYRPVRREVEWAPRFAMCRRSSRADAASDAAVRWHRTLAFTLDEVADLAEESRLCGRVEVEVADRLLSGLQVRHCDATGAPVSKIPRRTSRIVAEIRVGLREMLRRQTRSLLHRLSFTGVTFGERRVADVRSTLADCGLKVVPGLTVEGGGGSTEVVIAERPVGGETLRVMACLRGSRHEALRTTELAGGTSYRTKVESGDLEVVLHGRFRGSDETLAEVLDGVHERLRAVFSATTDHR